MIDVHDLILMKPNRDGVELFSHWGDLVIYFVQVWFG